MISERYREIDGDLIELALKGKFDVIAHGCNCFSSMTAGIALQMAKVFGTNHFTMELLGSNINKLGNIDYDTFILHDETVSPLKNYINNLNRPELVVANAYTQYYYGKNHSDGKENPLDYEALTLCMRKINNTFPGKHIGLPKIGAGLAGGDWERIKKIIQHELTDCQVTIVNYKK